MKTIKQTVAILGILSVLLTTSCSSQSPLSLPDSVRTMQEIFEGKRVSSVNKGELQVVVPASAGDGPGKPALLLPNPEIHMYVFPYLTQQDRVRIPGFWLAFNLYERDEPLLHHEIADFEAHVD